jgi:hypothetical protein
MRVRYSRIRSRRVYTDYVLIDYENVQPKSLEVLIPEHFKVLVFVGATQSRLPFSVVDSAQRLGTRAEYVRICGHGANSLDFHIAYYIGKLSTEDPSASFHIVSRDTGFDPLIQHLKAKNISVHRVKTVGEIVGEKTPKAEKVKKTIQAEDRFDVILASLQRMKASKPRSVKTLKGTIISLLHREVSEIEVAELIETLSGQGIISINNTTVTYTFPDGDAAIRQE